MKRKKLLRRLAEFLDRGVRKQRKRRDELEALLEKLGQKTTSMEAELSRERDKDKRKRLARDLEVVRAQHAKGTKALQSLEKA